MTIDESAHRQPGAVEAKPPVEAEETFVTAVDGTPLFVRRYRPAAPSRRTLLIVHGMSEHGGRYGHVAGLFQHRGWNVLLGDLRGHGSSGGTPTHVRHFREYVDDLARLWQEFGLDPAFTALLGHSMGALVAVRFAQLHRHLRVPMVLLSPLLGVRVPIDFLTLAVGWMLSWIAPTFRFRSRIDPVHTTRNTAAVAAREADPLMHRSVTARWYFAMKSAVAAAWQDAAAFSVPALILQAGDDRIVDPEAPARWLERTRCEQKTLRILAGHYHELHNEPDWHETLSAAADWLEARVPAEPLQTVDSSAGVCAAASK